MIEEEVIISKDGNIRIGTAFGDLGREYVYEPMYKTYGPSRHLTLLFNLFVWLQIFNFVNARKIEGEMNIFSELFASYWFASIIALIVVL
jgi:Ca2+ transporting ATPase